MQSLNHLTGKAWVKLSKSTWISRKLLKWSASVSLKIQSHFIMQQQKGNSKMTETVNKLIELFSKKGDSILDPFSHCYQFDVIGLERIFIGADQYHTTSHIDLLLSHIPQFDFKQIKNNYSAELKQWREKIQLYSQKIKTNGYVVLLVSDQRYQHRYYCRHADLIHYLENNTLILQGLINIIYDSNALKAYGYPSTYVPNIINQFALIFRKSSNTVDRTL